MTNTEALADRIAAGLVAYALRNLDDLLGTDAVGEAVRDAVAEAGGLPEGGTEDWGRLYDAVQQRLRTAHIDYRPCSEAGNMRTAALRHLDLASSYEPGSAGERYHSGAAATYSTLYTADTTTTHVAAVGRMAEMQKGAMASFDVMSAQQATGQLPAVDMADPELVVQVIVHGVVWPHLVQWLANRGVALCPLPLDGDEELPTYVMQPGPSVMAASADGEA